MDTHDQHSSFIKTPQQLVVVILLSFIVPIVSIILLVQLVTARVHVDPGQYTPEAVTARIAPVGRVEIGTGNAPAPQAKAGAAGQKAGPADGKSVYDKVCTACHAAGVAGAPKLGDKAAWAPRVKTGLPTLMQSVLKGKGAMPPKGGNPSLSDAEIRAAVDFMVSQSK